MIHEYMENLPQTRWVYCNRCKGDTNHRRNDAKICRDLEIDEDGDPGFEEISIYIFWSCCGCNSAVMEEQCWHSGMIDDNGKECLDSLFHPPRSRHHIKPKSFIKLPRQLRTIYQELLEAFNVEAHILAAAGLRALLEGICKEKGVSGGNLEKKIEGLKQHLPASIVDNLHEFRFIGNSAVHELEPPDRNDLRLAIEIVEDLLNFMYALDYKASSLGERRKYAKMLRDAAVAKGSP